MQTLDKYAAQAPNLVRTGFIHRPAADNIGYDFLSRQRSKSRFARLYHIVTYALSINAYSRRHLIRPSGQALQHIDRIRLGFRLARNSRIIRHHHIRRQYSKLRPFVTGRKLLRHRRLIFPVGHMAYVLYRDFAFSRGFISIRKEAMYRETQIP